MKQARMSWLNKIFIKTCISIFRKSRRTPRGFNQKIKYKAAFDRRDILTTFADKIAVREYVTNVIGGEYLTECYFNTDTPDEIDWGLIPNEFVMKANHCSGGSVIVWNGADGAKLLPKNKKDIFWNRYQVTPNNLVKKDLVNLANAWLKRNYAYPFPCRRIPEWAYLNVYPQILFEELLLDNQMRIAKDYKFHMFNGKCEIINVVERNKFKSTKPELNYSSIFDANWKNLHVSLNGNFPPVVLPEKPEKFDEMLEIATKLASGIDFVRVDLYNIDGRIVFGELTSYPEAGNNTYHFEPYSIPDKKKSVDFDEHLGAKLLLDNYELKLSKHLHS
jgi:hypothetical protein